MARVREIFKDHRTSRFHPTLVECGWQVVPGPSGEKLLQLSTYGSDDRASEKKVSQTIQVDESIAQELVTLLRSTFDL